jgi:hypothetical protein
MKKSIVTVLGMSLMGAAMYSSQASADQCTQNATSWFSNVERTCKFNQDGGEAYAKGMGGEISPGTKGLIGDLVSTYNITNGRYVYVASIGLDLSGQSISGCRAGNDTSTAQGQSAVDGTGCENGATYALYIKNASIL